MKNHEFDAHIANHPYVSSAALETARETGHADINVGTAAASTAPAYTEYAARPRLSTKGRMAAVAAIAIGAGAIPTGKSMVNNTLSHAGNASHATKSKP